MVTRAIFFMLVGAVAVQRVVELGVSRRNERWLRSQGAREYASGQLVAMKLVHAGWLIAMPLEVVLFNARFDPKIAVPAALVFAAGQLLRSAARRALGPRWSVRILVLPDRPLVTNRIYRYLRHPNYLGVALEIVALPLVHGAFRTALVFSVLNAAVLAARIDAEEHALGERCVTITTSS